MKLTPYEIARMMDLSAVRTNVDIDEVKKLAKVAKEYKPIMAYVMQTYIEDLKRMMDGVEDVGIGGSVSFPSGAETTATKIVQAKECVKFGCAEIDMVGNVGFLMSGRYSEYQDDIKAVVDAADGTMLKVILEVAYLTDEQIKKACELCIKAGADYVKTGTGWANKPTTVDHIKIMKQTVGDDIKIKAAGGVRSLDLLLDMYDAGATRFGVNMAKTVEIFEEAKKRYKA